MITFSASSPAPLPAGPLTISEVIDCYLANSARTYEARSLEERARALGLFVDSFGKRLVSDCRPADLVIWLNAHPEWVSNWTIRGTINAIQRPFNWAVKLRLIPDNPFRGVTYEEGEPRRPMTVAELHALLRSTTAIFRRVLMFLWLTGCRPGEMSASCWPDVDWDRGIIILRNHKTRKKTHKPRVIPLVDVALKLLRWMRARDPTGSGPIFRNQRGTAWNRSNMSLRMQRLREKAGVPLDCFLYGTRHHFGTAAVLSGAPLKLVSKAMGHSSVAVTEKFYVQVDGEIEAIRAAAELARRKKT